MVIDFKWFIYNSIKKGLVEGHIAEKVKLAVSDVEHCGAKFKEAVKKAFNATFLDDATHVIGFYQEDEENVPADDSSADNAEENNSEDDSKENPDQENEPTEDNADDSSEDGSNKETASKDTENDDAENSDPKNTGSDDNADDSSEETDDAKDEDDKKKKDKKEVNESVKVQDLTKNLIKTISVKTPKCSSCSSKKCVKENEKSSCCKESDDDKKKKKKAPKSIAPVMPPEHEKGEGGEEGGDFGGDAGGDAGGMMGEAETKASGQDLKSKVLKTVKRCLFSDDEKEEQKVELYDLPDLLPGKTVYFAKVSLKEDKAQ